eukprot:279670_1
MVILNNMNLFPNLTSLHFHSDEINFDNLSFTIVKEFCISIDLSQLNRMNIIGQCAETKLHSIEKLCFVLILPDTIEDNTVTQFRIMMHRINYRCRKLKLLQMVCIFETKQHDECECDDKFDVLCKVLQQMVKVWGDACDRDACQISPLTFKLHIKCGHDEHQMECEHWSSGSFVDPMQRLQDILQKMVVEYLGLYVCGKIQIKFTNDESVKEYDPRVFKKVHNLKHIFDVQSFTNYGNNQFLRKKREFYDGEAEFLKLPSDFETASVSIQYHRTDKERVIQMIPRWKTDCYYCDNTPWL